MAAWPTVADVKSALGVTTDAKDGVITAAVGAAIEQVAVDLGYLEIVVTESSGTFTLSGTLDPEEDSGPGTVTPSYSLNQAALILAVMTVKAPDAPYGIAAAFDLGAVRVAAQHPTYLRMLVGQRSQFGLV